LEIPVFLIDPETKNPDEVETESSATAAILATKPSAAKTQLPGEYFQI
jgi:hypothetical protein